jgi:TPR repeat protein
MRRALICTFTLLMVTASQGQSLSQKLAKLTPADMAPLAEKARDGDYQSQVLLAYAYERGYAVARDPATARRWFLLAAEHGSGELQFHVAGLYGHGIGGPPDAGQEFKWTLRAAQQGHLAAEFNVSSMYGKGHGTERNTAEAEKWLRIAAEGGFSEAQYELGLMYAKGKLAGGVNTGEAEKWLSRAAAQNHEVAVTALASLYMSPEGIPLDAPKVEALLLRAADMDNAHALYQLGQYYRRGTLGGKVNSPKAITMFTEAARDGYAPAQFDLASMYEAGEGVDRGLAKALAWYLKAAELGYTPAMLKAGQMLRDGQGASADPSQAALWFAVAAHMGDQQGQEELALLDKRAPGLQVQGDGAAQEFLQSHPEAAANKPGEFRYHSGIVVWDPSDKLKRGPSTLEERNKAVAVARTLEQAPLGPNSAALREWLDTWWRDIPDWMIKTCPILPVEPDYAYAALLQTQVTLSSGAYLLDKRYEVRSQEELFAEGIRGALRAYLAILQANPEAHSAALDELQAKSAKMFPQEVAKLMSQRCH